MSRDTETLLRALIDYYLGVMTLSVRVRLPHHLELLTALGPSATWPACVEAPKPWRETA